MLGDTERNREGNVLRRRHLALELDDRVRAKGLAIDPADVCACRPRRKARVAQIPRVHELLPWFQALKSRSIDVEVCAVKREELGLRRALGVCEERRDRNVHIPRAGVKVKARLRLVEAANGLERAQLVRVAHEVAHANHHSNELVGGVVRSPVMHLVVHSVVFVVLIVSLPAHCERFRA
eukprot:Amastigsp_a531_208.p3 type:complete len:180 gc:universal Amastigsp_a531_208:598-59(-)